MPSRSPAQKRLMAAAAHSSSFAKKVGVSQTVAKEFNRADQKHPRVNHSSGLAVRKKSR